MGKPSVTVNCVANRYTGDGERIIEFDHKGKGGLIGFAELSDGRLMVHVYREDEEVVVGSKERSGLLAAPISLRAAYGNCGTTAQQEAADLADEMIRRFA